MKTNTLIVTLKHKDTTFTASLSCRGAVISAHFKKIGNDLYLVDLKQPETFHFMELVPFKERGREMKVLLPLAGEYKERKLTKVAKLLTTDENETIDIPALLVNLLTVERYLTVTDYLDFFGLHYEQMLDFLTEKETQQQIKLIEVASLTITSMETLNFYRQQLDALFTDCYTGRMQSLLLSDIEAKLELSMNSIFFKYLLRSMQESFSYKIHLDKIVFKKLALSETEKVSLTEMETILHKNKITVFSINDILLLTGLEYKDVNATLWFMIGNGQVMQLDQQFFIFTEDFNKIINKLKKYIRNEGEWIDIAAFRELTQLSRKYVITLLEYFDTQHITERVGNKRRILLGV